MQEDTKTLWIVGRITNEEATQWEFVGAFSDEGIAHMACLDADHFMAPAELDIAVHEANVPWPGARYPRATGSPGDVVLGHDPRTSVGFDGAGR